MADSDTRHEPLVSLTLEPEAQNPRVRVVLAGRVNGHAVADAFIKLYDEHPEAVVYDRLFDFTRYDGGFELEHLQRITPAYHRALGDRATHPCRTAFVTYDPNFGLWVRAMNFQFDGRELRAVSTFEEAEAFLAVPPERRRAG